MTTLLLPGPDDDDPDDSNEPTDEPSEDRSRSRGSRGSSGPRGSRHRRQSSILSEIECLKQLQDLSGLVAIGVMAPSRANTIRANLKETLTYHRRNQSSPDGQKLPDADVLKLARENPEYLSMLEPFLTDEQLDIVMRDAGPGEDE